uniref:Uncharacterized protein n=1 Tax=Myotis myotis TaxID=51298 RepID=A0A7J7V3X1_MYOMY|nr:hypothetical protein mMyoMyo1_008499 [Myotis myotis]
MCSLNPALLLIRPGLARTTRGRTALRALAAGGDGASVPPGSTPCSLPPSTCPGPEARGCWGPTLELGCAYGAFRTRPALRTGGAKPDTKPGPGRGATRARWPRRGRQPAAAESPCEPGPARDRRRGRAAAQSRNAEGLGGGGAGSGLKVQPRVGAQRPVGGRGANGGIGAPRAERGCVRPRILRREPGGGAEGRGSGAESREGVREAGDRAPRAGRRCGRPGIGRREPGGSAGGRGSGAESREVVRRAGDRAPRAGRECGRPGIGCGGPGIRRREPGGSVGGRGSGEEGRRPGAEAARPAFSGSAPPAGAGTAP